MQVHQQQQLGQVIVIQRNEKRKVMSKNKTVEKNMTKKVDHKARWKEARENLTIQLKESIEQIEFHKTRATKIQGVMEVNDQLFLENNEENNNK